MDSKRFLIIGGTHGIGQELQNQLAEEGHEVITVARSEKAMHHCDISDLSMDLPLIDEPIDGLVYCPGTVNLKPFSQISIEDFQHDWEINALGAFRVTQNYLKILQGASNPSIVFFSTVASKIGMPFHTSIASAKGAVEGLTRSLAAELAPKIRVNAIALSLTETPLVESMIDTDAKREAIASRHPLKRIGTTEDIASMAFYLLSQNSSWITGQVFAVDGGMSSIKLF